MLNEEIVKLHREGLTEGAIVKQLGVTRHEARTAIVFEEGRQAGLAEASLNRSKEIHPATGIYDVPPAAPHLDGKSLFDEPLIAAIVRCIRDGKPVPEKSLRDQYGVSHNAMYKYRAIAADRVQWGWKDPQ